MGDENTIISTDTELRHMLGRALLGASPKDLKKAKNLVGASRGAAADYVLGLKRKTLKLKPDEPREMHDTWVRHMLKGKSPCQDKAVLLWHDHFATSASVVEYEEAVVEHFRLHYESVFGNFKDYVKAINTDPAMMIFLDTILNKKAIPNENYARELCELFTIREKDLNGVANYTQADIVQIARAFTGWTIEEDGAFFDADQHDFDAEFSASRGPKVLFDNAHGFPPGGVSFTTAGEGAAEIDTVIEILFAHTDSDGMNTVARAVANKMIEFYCYANPDKADVDAVVAASGFEVTWNLEALMRAIFVHDVFWETAAGAPYDANTKKSVKWPIDFVVGTMRSIDMKARGRYLYLPGGEYLDLFDHLSNMGQIVGEPPSVFGWDWEESWISSSTLLARYTFARDIGNARYGGKFRSHKLVNKKLTDPGEIADAAIAALGMTGQFTSAERDDLIDYLTDNGANPTLDLKDKYVLNLKLNGLFALLMQSPQFQLH